MIKKCILFFNKLLASMYFSNNNYRKGSTILEENYDDFEEINKEISRVIIEMKNKDNDESFQIYNYNQNKSYNYKFVEVKQNFFSSTNNTSYINNINEGKIFNQCIYNNNNNNNFINVYKSINNNFSFDNHNEINKKKNNLNYKELKKNKIKNNAKKKKLHLDSSKNLIHLDNVIKLKDKRTTLIIRNIPNKYTINLLLEEINVHFLGKYDLLYLPLDFINNTNLGYGFINFIDPIHIMYFYDEFIGKKWNNFNSDKKCQLAYAKIQGKNEILKYMYKKNNISMINQFKSNNIFYIENTNFICNEIEIPLKYYISFINYYPYSLCHKKNNFVFVVDKFFKI